MVHVERWVLQPMRLEQALLVVYTQRFPWPGSASGEQRAGATLFIKQLEKKLCLITGRSQTLENSSPDGLRFFLVVVVVKERYFICNNLDRLD